MKRFLSIFIILFLSISVILCFPKKSYATEATVNISLTTNTTSVIVGQDVEVTISISSNIEMLFAEFLLNYDNTKFDFVSGDELGGSAYAGVIPYNMDYPINTGAIGQPTSYQYKVVLRAKTTTDTTDITVSDVVVTGCDTNVEEHYLTPTIKNVTGIKIWAQGSDDATLSTLQVAGFTLQPAFAKWTTDYIVYIDSNTTAVDIVAQATQAAQGGRVEISGNTTNLAFGSNFVTIKSYAPNGKVITYTVNICRLDPPTEPPTTEAPTEPPAWSEVVVDDNSYNISADFTVDQIPAGFVSTLYDYKGNETLGVVNNTLGLDLLYLMDGEQNGKFFIYDKVADSFYPYIVIYSLNNSYVVLPIDLAKDSPTSGTEGTLTIGEQQINGLVDNEDGDFSYFYGINQNGEYSWYCYDSVEGTIQRFHNVVVEGSTKEEEVTPEAEPSQENQDNSTDNNYASEKESLLAENDGLIKIRNIAFAVAAALLFILIGLVVFLIAHKSEEKHANKEDVDYVKLEKEIEASEKEVSKEKVSETVAEDAAEETLDVESVYDEAISMQMAATKEMIDEEESLDSEEDLLSDEEDEEIDRMLEDDEKSEQPEIISLDDEELL